MIKESGSQPPSQVGVYQRIAECKEAAATAAHNGTVYVAQKMHCAHWTKKVFGSSHSPPPDGRKKSRKAVGFNCGNWVRGGESVI